MIASSFMAGAAQSHSSISALRACDAQACDLFMRQLDPQDIKLRFGALHRSIEYFLPDDNGTNRRVTFAASNATGTIVGILTLAVLSAESVEIGIVVRSDLKGRGIGRALLAHAFEWAEANGISYVVASIDHENHRMRALALAAGFRVVGYDTFCIKVAASIFPGKNSLGASGAVDVYSA